MQVNLLAHNTKIIRCELYSGRLIDQGIKDVCNSLKQLMCSSFRNNHRIEQPTSVPAALKQRNKGALPAVYSWIRPTLPPVYINLPCVLVQVAGFPVVYP